MIDIIGDVHGHADKLEALLQQLGYIKNSGAYAQALGSWHSIVVSLSI